MGRFFLAKLILDLDIVAKLIVILFLIDVVL